MKHNLNRVGYILFLNLSIIFFVLTLLNLLSILDLSFLVSNNTLASFLIVSLTATIFCKYNLDEYYHRYSSFARSIIDSAQYFFISLLILLTINQFLKLDFLINRNLILVVSAIGFGFLTFYKNRDRVEKEIEDEKQKEEDEEKQRYHDFEYKFPTLNRIWGLKHIVRWMYKEGWFYSVGLILIIFYGSFLRFFELGKQSLWIDEIYSYQAVDSIIKNGIPVLSSGITYYREIVYSYIVAGIVYFLGNSELILRTVSAIVGTVSIWIIYLIVKKIFNKRLAIFSTLIFSLLVWEIIYSRILRFYILNQFLYM